MALVDHDGAGLAVSQNRHLAHRHNNLPSDHPHLAGAGGGRHAHAFVIDDFYREWPERVG